MDREVSLPWNMQMGRYTTAYKASFLWPSREFLMICSARPTVLPLGSEGPAKVQTARRALTPSLRARNDESSPVGGADCKTWAHRYAPWRSLRRKSRNALSAGRIWRRLG